MDELRARVTSDLARLKKGGVGAAEGADPNLQRKTLLGIQTRLDDLSSRVSRLEASCLHLTRSSSALRSQFEAVVKLKSVLQETLSGPVVKARAIAGDVVSNLTSSLNTAAIIASTASTADNSEDAVASTSSPNSFASALAERSDLRERAIALASEAREILDQVEDVAMKANQLQVCPLKICPLWSYLCPIDLSFQPHELSHAGLVTMLAY